MKRYITTLALVLLAAAGFSTYYAFGSADHLPEYRLETLEGDANEAANLVLDGSYIGGKGSQPIKLSVQGIEYRSRESLYDAYITNARSWFDEQTGVKELIEQYPDFMRGKGEIRGLFANKEWAAYAEIPYESSTGQSGKNINVDILNRNTGEAIDYTIPLSILSPEGLREQAYIADVQLQEDLLHVLVYQNVIGGAVKAASQHYDYIIEKNSGELLSSAAIEFIDESGNKLSPDSYESVQSFNAEPKDYYVFSSVKKTTEPNRNISIEIIGMYAYSYKSGNVIRLSNQALQRNNKRSEPQYMTGDQLYFTSYNRESIQVTSFSLETGERMEESLFLTLKQLEADEIKTSFMRADRLFILYANRNKLNVAVLNIKTGEQLYKGEVAASGNEQEQQIALSDISLHSIGLRN
ncbi:hypothetical protein [Paenibacillus sp. KS-LC4]|uniref:hypothetical protein n=1 Tax=Paenibacillus sp. KS-LC4 TaxID=2979727 RepID=UPI0030CAECC4